MNKHLLIGALVASALLITPILASAQSNTANTDVTTQIQSLLSQINSLEQQLHTLVQSAASTTTLDWVSPSINLTGSSTPPQMRNGMPPMPCINIARDLSQGAQGSDVVQLQQMLAGDGFFSASTTGFFGPATAHALAAFQSAFGVSASSTGVFGPLTRMFLQSHCGAQGGGMATSTPPMPPPMWQGSSTPATLLLPPPSWGNASGTPAQWSASSSAPRAPWMGTSTPPAPCQGGTSQTNQAAAIALALFVPHVVLPGMFQGPCAHQPLVSQ